MTVNIYLMAQEIGEILQHLIISHGLLFVQNFIFVSHHIFKMSYIKDFFILKLFDFESNFYQKYSSLTIRSYLKENLFNV